jgi:hypothetical protein
MDEMNGQNVIRKSNDMMSKDSGNKWKRQAMLLQDIKLAFNQSKQHNYYHRKQA